MRHFSPTLGPPSGVDMVPARGATAGSAMGVPVAGLGMGWGGAEATAGAAAAGAPVNRETVAFPASVNFCKGTVKCRPAASLTTTLVPLTAAETASISTPVVVETTSAEAMHSEQTEVTAKRERFMGEGVKGAVRLSNLAKAINSGNKLCTQSFAQSPSSQSWCPARRQSSLSIGLCGWQR